MLLPVPGCPFSLWLNLFRRAGRGGLDASISFFPWVPDKFITSLFLVLSAPAPTAFSILAINDRFSFLACDCEKSGTGISPSVGLSGGVFSTWPNMLFVSFLYIPVGEDSVRPKSWMASPPSGFWTFGPDLPFSWRVWAFSKHDGRLREGVSSDLSFYLFLLWALY